MLADAARLNADQRARLDGLARRLDAAPLLRLQTLRDRLEARDRLRQTLGHVETLKRGYAVVRADGQVVTSKARAETATALDLEFHDGHLTLGAKPAKRLKDPAPGQGSLF